MAHTRSAVRGLALVAIIVLTGAVVGCSGPTDVPPGEEIEVAPVDGGQGTSDESAIGPVNAPREGGSGGYPAPIRTFAARDAADGYEGPGGDTDAGESESTGENEGAGENAGEAEGNDG